VVGQVDQKFLGEVAGAARGVADPVVLVGAGTRSGVIGGDAGAKVCALLEQLGRAGQVPVVVSRDRVGLASVFDRYNSALVTAVRSDKSVADDRPAVWLDNTPHWSVRLPGGEVVISDDQGQPFGSVLARALHSAAGRAPAVMAFSPELTAWLKSNGDWARSREVFTASRGSAGGSLTAAHNRQAVSAAAQRVPDDEAVQVGKAILEVVDAQERGATFDAFGYLQGTGDRVGMIFDAVPQGAVPLSTLATLARNVPGQGTSVSLVEAIDMVKKDQIGAVSSYLMNNRPDLTEKEKLDWVHRILALQPAMPELEHQLTELAQLVLTCW
jgi:hypothetical protein